MKYIMEAIMRTKSKYLLILSIGLSCGYLVVNALTLSLLAKAINTNSMEIVKMVIIASVIQIGISTAQGFTGMYRHLSFTYLCNKFSSKILDADVAMFNKFSPGTIEHVGGKLYMMTNLPSILIGMGQDVGSVIVNLVAIWIIQPHVVLPLIGIFAVCFIVTAILNKQWGKIDKAIEKEREARDVELDEITNGFMEVRSFPNTIESHRTAIVEGNGKIVKHFFKRQKLNSGMNFSISLLDTLAMLVVLLYVVSTRLAGTSTLAATTSVTLVIYVWRIVDPLLSIVFSFSDLSEYKSAIPKFNDIMNYENSIVDGNIELSSFDNKISINNVSFSYNESNSVLENVTMEIPKGKRIGICGVSGGGKSTLLKLLTRFYDVDAGSIEVDGINIKNLKLSSLRSYIGIVHQSTYIFDGTIRDNIAYALRPSIPSDEVIMEACKKACFYDFIVSLPEGLNTKVGPRGLKLSGGQKQRIGLARIFLMDPEIVVLDEATSALDSDTEAVIQDALNGFKGKTVIAIAHRLSTIKDSDNIVVIDNHSVAEQGTHSELMEMGGIYAGMYSA